LFPAWWFNITIGNLEKIYYQTKIKGIITGFQKRYLKH